MIPNAKINTKNSAQIIRKEARNVVKKLVGSGSYSKNALNPEQGVGSSQVINRSKYTSTPTYFDEDGEFVQIGRKQIAANEGLKRKIVVQNRDIRNEDVFGDTYFNENASTPYLTRESSRARSHTDVRQSLDTKLPAI